MRHSEANCKSFGADVFCPATLPESPPFIVLNCLASIVVTKLEISMSLGLVW